MSVDTDTGSQTLCCIQWRCLPSMLIYIFSFILSSLLVPAPTPQTYPLFSLYPPWPSCYSCQCVNCTMVGLLTAVQILLQDLTDHVDKLAGVVWQVGHQFTQLLNAACRQHCALHSATHTHCDVSPSHHTTVHESASVTSLLISCRSRQFFKTNIMTHFSEAQSFRSNLHTLPARFYTAHKCTDARIAYQTVKDQY